VTSNAAWVISRPELRNRRSGIWPNFPTGDARKALNALEIAVLTTAPERIVTQIDLAAAEQSIQKKAVVYDDEDAHYDTISAFIKSMRGSDPDATLYWLAKMIHAGEDPRFIARRIVIQAAEDVGLADPMALVLANAAFQAAEFIGWPKQNSTCGRPFTLPRRIRAIARSWPSTPPSKTWNRGRTWRA
jgi:replication-associated recombination protein RarA